MTYNPACVKTIIDARQFLPDNFLALDIGSQTLTYGVEEYADVPGLYAALGAARYDAIDFDGKGTVDADLNQPVNLPDSYNLVVNNGTGEHIFNVPAVFQTVHDNCAKGGIMIHVLPWINWRNHGFFNFHPVLFNDMALANNYEILSCFATDRNGESQSPAGFAEIKAGPDGMLADESLVNFNAFVVVVMRKRGESPFRFPVQGKYNFTFPMYDAFGEAEVLTEPFPHFRTRMHPDLYRELERTFPTDGFVGKDGQNVLQQISAPQIIRDLPPVWRDFAQYACSTGFLQRVIAAFAEFMPPTHPAKHYDLEAVLRGHPGPWQLDCQAAINTPVERVSRVRGPHIDDPREVYAGLVYFPVEGDAAGGDLELYRWKGARKFVGRKGMKKKAEVPMSAVELVATVPYEAGEAIFFLNSPDALHGISPRRKTDTVRRYINIIGEINEPGFELK